MNIRQPIFALIIISYTLLFMASLVLVGYAEIDINAKSAILILFIFAPAPTVLLAYFAYEDSKQLRALKEEINRLKQERTVP